MNAYFIAMRQAKLDGYYVPEIEIIYLRYDNFLNPHVLEVSFFH